MNWIQQLVSGQGFMPHGYSYLWDKGLLGIHVLSDGLVALSYYSIPLALFYFVRRRRDIEFSWLLVCFAVFMVACGTSHVMEIWTVWHPADWLSGAVKALTALASLSTAILLVKWVPKAVASWGVTAAILGSKGKSAMELLSTSLLRSHESLLGRCLEPVYKQHCYDSCCRRKYKRGPALRLHATRIEFCPQDCRCPP